MFSLQLKTLTLLHTLTTKSKYIINTEYKHPVHFCCSVLMMMMYVPSTDSKPFFEC